MGVLYTANIIDDQVQIPMLSVSTLASIAGHLLLQKCIKPQETGGDVAKASKTNSYIRKS